MAEAVLLRRNDTVAHGLHAEHADVMFHEHGEDFLFEAVIMRVHDVKRHLHGVKRELVSKSRLQHL